VLSDCCLPQSYAGFRQRLDSSHRPGVSGGARWSKECGLGTRIGYMLVSIFGRSTLGLSYSIFIVDCLHCTGVSEQHGTVRRQLIRGRSALAKPAAQLATTSAGASAAFWFSGRQPACRQRCG
jgi:hypothetical protein